MDLTKTQQKIFDFVVNSIAEDNMPPTMREIAQAMGYKSDNAAYEHLRALAKKGYVELGGKSRGIRLLKTPGNNLLGNPFELPIVGRVAAGSPILAQEHVEGRLPYQKSMFNPAADYLLRVKGDSMINVGIMEDDLLAVHKTTDVQQNQIVVARLEDEVTVKRFQRKDNQVSLVPENDRYQPIIVNLDSQPLHIEGIMVGLVRSSVSFN